MNSTDEAVSWVVYHMTLHKDPEGKNAVCSQGEWEAMELLRPGYHKLIRAGFAHEAEAERLARGTSGDALGRRGSGSRTLGAR